MDTFSSKQAGMPLVLNGVRYGLLEQGQNLWRMGSTNPLWMQEMPLGPVSDECRTQLATKGIWLQPMIQEKPRLAVMCCGQGSVWPGMGRELYDSFPVARAAMDEIASFANWDVLALMDETDPNVIGQSRWQQPYLFLLEYAQWSVYRSLGLEPNIVCGHSLGELIGLCVSGLIAPEVAWMVFDTRSRHMADLEAHSTRETGMMAVYASEEDILEAQSRWPNLYVSNYNTPGQFILSGPRDVLSEARKAFRKKHHPAIILNITLAFHHPSMRVLRDISERRLLALEMHAPAKIPLLSCVTAGFYPDTQEEVCRYIVDLDENSVRWVEAVRAMRGFLGITHFLELGPQDTLCGLVGEIEKRSVCISASSKGRERDAMRRSLAQLYSLGLLSHTKIVSLSSQKTEEHEEEGAKATPPASPPVSHQEKGKAPDRVLSVIQGILGKACQKEVRPEMDLRFDLALRSSVFPHLIEEMQKQLGVTVQFEDLLRVATVRDLASLFSGDTQSEERQEAHLPLGSLLKRPFFTRCTERDGVLQELPLNPALRLAKLDSSLVIALYGKEQDFLPGLLSGLLSFKPLLLVSGAFTRLRSESLRFGARILDLYVADGGLENALRVQSRVNIVIATGEAITSLSPEGAVLLWRELVRVQCSLLIVFRKEKGEPLSFTEKGIRVLDIVCEARPSQEELGDLLAREIMCGESRYVRWLPSEKVELKGQGLLDVADAFPVVFPQRKSGYPRTGRVLSSCAHFSSAAEPSLRERTVLPKIMQIRAAVDASCMLLPWLKPIGLADFHFFASAKLSEGLTREAEITTGAGGWLRHDVMVRLTRNRLAIRDLRENGRRKDSYSDLSDGVVLMSGCEPQIKTLWSLQRGCAQGVLQDTEAWYDAQGISPCWRMVKNCVLRPDGVLEAELVGQSLIALKGNWKYDIELSAIEGILQGTRMAFEFAPPQTQGPFRLNLIGLIRFGQGKFSAPWNLQLKKRWDDASIVRYDAQVTDSCGNCLLSARHIEFSSVSASVASR